MKIKKNIAILASCAVSVLPNLASADTNYITSCTPPVSCIYNWWPAETNANDIISADNGTLKNGATYAPGIVGQAFSLNRASHSYVEAAHDNVWGFGANDFTIELWTKLKTWTPANNYYQPDAIFIGDDDSAHSFNKWFFAIHDGKLTFHVNSPTLGSGLWLVDAAFTPVTNQWYHLAITRQGSLYTIYTNGVVAGTATSTNTIPNPSAPLTIGQAENLGYIDGLIDEPSIYLCALSQTNIQAIYLAGSYGKCEPTDCTPPVSCIYNWWPAETNVNDIISGDNGTLMNGATYAPGIVGQAFSLSQASQSYIEVAHDNVWGFGTDDFTIELWTKLNTWNPGNSYYEPDAIFIGDDDSAHSFNKWFFAIHNNMLTFHVNSPTLGSGLWLVDAAFTPATNQWYHLAITRQGSLYTIYTNGVAAGTATSTNSIPNPSAPLTIGQAEDLGFIDGLIDEPSIYRCALSLTNIQAIFNAGSYGKCR